MFFSLVLDLFQQRCCEPPVDEPAAETDDARFEHEEGAWAFDIVPGEVPGELKARIQEQNVVQRSALPSSQRPTAERKVKRQVSAVIWQETDLSATGKLNGDWDSPNTCCPRGNEESGAWRPPRNARKFDPESSPQLPAALQSRG
eukprot:TRINITY_DN27441_c0_g1_i1.p1 TRINITY_DN27441_c0_g1~~TRINITY_DN27441_c0_g1_i1.p1  ORF type:complete len:145 (+),score=24.55 TRINITY_DN27441_c0_g1_i1:97-531(+)